MPDTDPSDIEMAPYDGATVVLVGCGDAKSEGTAAAKDLYTSTYFKAKRRYAEAAADLWYIFSAEYGLLAPNEIVETYDTTIENVDEHEWDQQIAAQLPNLTGATVQVLAGEDYIEPIEETLTLYADAVEYPTEGMPIDERIQWLQERAAEIDTEPDGKTIREAVDTIGAEAVRAFIDPDDVVSLDSAVAVPLANAVAQLGEDRALEIVAEREAATIDEAPPLGERRPTPDAEPTPPADLAEYVREGVERQDPATLRALAEWAIDLAAWREREVDDDVLEDEIEADEELVDVEEPGEEGGGATVIKKVPCGKDCEGCPHGPYKYVVTRDGDSLNWEYKGAVET